MRNVTICNGLQEQYRRLKKAAHGHPDTTFHGKIYSLFIGHMHVVILIGQIVDWQQ
jgi:hypothetical protein